MVDHNRLRRSTDRDFISRTRADFDEKWEAMDSDLNHKFNVLFIVAILFSIAMTIAVCVGTYLAIKKWG